MSASRRIRARSRLRRGTASTSPGCARASCAPADYRDFDWLLCADRDNLRDVRALAPLGIARDRVALLLEWAGQGAGAEIADPYTGGGEQFEAGLAAGRHRGRSHRGALRRPAGGHGGAE